MERFRLSIPGTGLECGEVTKYVPTRYNYYTYSRDSAQTTVVMTNANGEEFTGQARRSNGKTTGIKFTGPRLSGTLTGVRIVGRQELTNSEKARNELILLCLRRQKFLRDSPFIRQLWFPSRRNRTSAQTARVIPPLIPSLNLSQSEAVQAMVSGAPLVIVHGKKYVSCGDSLSNASHERASWDRKDNDYIGGSIYLEQGG